MARALAGCLLAVLGLGATTVADAACDAGRLVFSCATARGNEIELCEDGPSVRYSFGEPGLAPQLAITLPRTEVQRAPLRELGKVESYALRIPYREATHILYWSLDDAGAQPEAGVQVFVEDRLRATMHCIPGQVRSNLSKAGFGGGSG
ncbi:MAG TPA: hypothetical protein VJM11_13605 [Nevskiaceae bacterium]|nr:hypothetical protein [Nevskiaceae bacterium]